MDTDRLSALIADALGGLWPQRGDPGFALAVHIGEHTAFTFTTGLADRASGRPITVDTVFNIGSTSKQFTAFAALLLADEGKLDLDASIAEILPELARTGSGVSARQLIHHAGGLRDYLTLLELTGRTFWDHATKAETMAQLSAQKGTLFPAGTRFSYSNTGYFVLSAMVERLSGKSLAAFSQENIFQPLGMTRSTVVDCYPAGIENMARGYRPARGGFDLCESRWEQTGDGQVHSTVMDLALWSHNLSDGKVGGPAVAALMAQPGRLADGTSTGYAGGLEIEERGSHRILRHDGSWGGYRADFARIPDLDLTVAILANRTDVPILRLTNAILDLALPSAKKPAGRPQRASTGTPEPGVYREPESGRYLMIRRQDAGYILEMASDRYLLDKAGEDWRVLEDDGTEAGEAFVFTQDRIEMDEGDGPAAFLRVKPDDTASDDVAGYYVSDEALAEAHILLGRSGLFLAISGGLVALQAGMQDEFFTTRSPLNSGRCCPILVFEREAGRICGFRYRSHHVDGVVFRRLERQ